MSSGTPPRQDSVVPPCSLCGARDAEPIITGDGRHYLNCPLCTLIYLHPEQRLSATAERARYELHENDGADRDYVSFLHRLADPVMERLRPGARGLDFGCGPAPVLSELLTSAGFPCAAYDPFFAAEEALLAGRYDYVTCSEVVEHARNPAETFAALGRLLKPGGILGVMTRFIPENEPFASWWYRRDPTHVSFYRPSTMRWIGERHGWRTEFPRPNITIFMVPG